MKRFHKKSFSKLLGTLYAIPLMNLVNQLKIKYRNHSHIYSSEGRLLSEQVANLLKGLKSELGLKKEGTEIKQPLASKVILGEDLTKDPGFKDLEQIIKGIEDGSISEKRILNLLKGLKSELGLKKEGTEIKQPLASKVILGEDLTKDPGFKDLEQIIKGIEDGSISEKRILNLLKGLKSELGLKKEGAEIKQPLASKVILGEDLTKDPGFKDLEQIIKGIEDGSISEKRILNLLKGLKSELLKKEGTEIKQPLASKVILGEDLTKDPGFKDLEQIIKGIEDGSISEKRILNLLKGLKSELGLKKEGAEIKQPLASKVILGQNLTITQVEASKQASRQQQNTGDIIYKIIHFIEKNINSLVYKGHEHIKIETEPPNLGCYRYRT
ncbi:hypothetical protein DMNBHIDG_00923 [Candidatus Methanoperedenaceae archaeon GB37]|nr:hypothetical protein DMNBHIDG_00923 [Candidatus Methanoperedenaceae archaeon GB37]